MSTKEPLLSSVHSPHLFYLSCLVHIIQTTYCILLYFFCSAEFPGDKICCLLVTHQSLHKQLQIYEAFLLHQTQHLCLNRLDLLDNFAVIAPGFFIHLRTSSCNWIGAFEFWRSSQLRLKEVARSFLLRCLRCCLLDKINVLQRSQDYQPPPP